MCIVDSFISCKIGELFFFFFFFFSNITPVPKGGDPKLVSNYRPISLLSLPSKILERIIYNHSSQVTKVSSGVPQGSILGPLLFSIYIDQLCNIPLSATSKIQLYADDILLHKPIGRDSTSDVANLQSDINSVAAWVKLSGLRLNTQKTKFVLISRLRHPPPIKLSVDGTTFSRVPSVTYLGVSISSDLSWASHIETVCCKAKRQIGLLHRHFHAGSPSCKSQLYKSLVLPILDYCSSLWDPNYAVHVNKPESVQKLAARFVSGRWNDNYDSLLNCLNWSELSTRRKKQKLSLRNRIVKGYSILPPSFFTPHPFPHLRHNHSLPLYHPPCRSTAHLSSFSVSVVPLWNHLPIDIVCAPSLYSFKKRLNSLNLP